MKYSMHKKRVYALCKKIVVLVIVAAAFILNSAITFAETDNEILLKDGWVYRWGESPIDSGGIPSWVHGYTGSGWKDTSGRLRLETSGTASSLWMKTLIPKSSWYSSVLYFGGSYPKSIMADSVEAYVDGKLIYKASDSISNLKGAVLSNFFIQLKPEYSGKVLALGFHAAKNKEIGIGGSAKIVPQDVVISNLGVQNVSDMIFSFFFLLTFIVSISLTFFLTKSVKKVFIALGFAALFNGLATISQNPTVVLSLINSIKFWHMVMYLSTACIITPFAFFFEQINHEAIYRSILRKLGYASIIFAAFANLLTIIYCFTGRLGYLWFFTNNDIERSFFAVAVLIFISIAFITSFKGNSESKIISMGVILGSPIVIFQLVTSIKVAQWGVFIFFVSLLVVSAKRFLDALSSLEAYSKELETHKKGLEKIIASLSAIFEIRSQSEFAPGVLTHLLSLLDLDHGPSYTLVSGFMAEKKGDSFYMTAATISYLNHMNKNLKKTVPHKVMPVIENCIASNNKFSYPGGTIIVHFKSISSPENLIYIDCGKTLSEWERNMVEVFCSNVSIALENIYLHKEIEDTQREVIFTLVEISEARSFETGNHVKRVAEYTKLLASKYGLTEEEAELIRLASPMHDIGKIAIPDSVLNKAGRYTDEEYEIMKRHPILGYDMLKGSDRPILKAASISALQHHEMYNGNGYPYGLKGEEIHIYGRLTAVADVFDALSSERIYKDAWKADDVLRFFKKEKGERFDPILADILINNFNEMLNIRKALADK